MEDVACAGGVDAINHERRRVDELPRLERQRAMSAQCHRGYAHFILALDHFERAERIALIGPLDREFGAGDEIIHMRQDAIEAVMESCRKVVAFLSPEYFHSVECKEELSMARLRHKRENQSVLLPLYVRSLEDAAELPLWLQTVTYADCRETDEAKLAAAVARLTRGAGG